MPEGEVAIGLDTAQLIIGVSGHRDLRSDQIAALGLEVDGLFTALQELVPKSAIRVTSGLAEGADLLVASRAVLQGIRVDAVLPMAYELYVSDFSPGGRRQLDELLAHPLVEKFELARPADLKEAAVAAPGPDRDRLYANLGDYLVRSSNVLVALWDGKSTGLAGGTSDVVGTYLGVRTEGSQAEARIQPLTDDASMSTLDLAFVYWVPADRQGQSSSSSSAESRHASFLTGGGGGSVWQHADMPAEFKQQLEDLDAYNEEYEHLVANGRLQPSSGLLADVSLDGDDPSFDELRRVDHEYRKSDALAVYFQTRSDRLFKFFSVAAATMGIVFLLFAKIVAVNGFLFIYLGVFVLGVFAAYIAARRRWLGKHLTYRALAETMRTRFYLVLGGAERDVDVSELMRTTGTHHLPGFGLIGGLVQATGTPTVRVRTAASVEGGAEYVRHAWVEDQAAYFRSKIRKMSRTHHRLGRVRLLAVVVFIGAAVVLIVSKKSLSEVNIYEFAQPEHGHGNEPVSVKTFLLFLMGLLPFLLGVWEVHSNKLATKELLWQYRNQADYFALANRELEATTSTDGRQRVLAVLGRRSLIEGYQWAMHRFHREHEPPVAG